MARAAALEYCRTIAVATRPLFKMKKQPATLSLAKTRRSRDLPLKAPAARNLQLQALTLFAFVAPAF